ncbi:MAG: hypothetical protein A3C84_02960 [Candidatus Ryanbacteria bacterium RIFCSPHIGHO2_02_FULL_48_12]|uniref:Uncharacterized protein n=1 Tax=Candidatus Ryanbacteria bacterium RIFCSPHIGHO2_01_FULL_48_27 TaxID=1802115 RepID=A0A1G2G4W3_9BACT|nr:MAG: hypothetical protein A2756_01430 [Candidatus Ryanbacteria bacterium RIFCSPHIGHO2_01_FULL_48_27]OGZ49061.1 MAG: hypothetical protein A3C84_02960 [Candidatus Ryanbacteria bacterium RIFCSPHIGHO2_02_FULL_48_12]
MLHKKIVDRGNRLPYRLLIISTTKNGNEHSPRTVSHVIGSENIAIHGREGEGIITIHGRQKIKELRDALTEICAFMEIR